MCWGWWCLIVCGDFVCFGFGFRVFVGILVRVCLCSLVFWLGFALGRFSFGSCYCACLGLWGFVFEVLVGALA